MSLFSLGPLAYLGALLIVIGMASSVIPVLPGPLFVWVGAMVWAWADGFQQVGWVTLVILGILALVGTVADILLSTLMSRRAGASWKSVLGALCGGIVGGTFFSGVPILGTMIGAVLGSIAGLCTVEYLEKSNWRAAAVAARAYLSSVLLTAMVEMSISFVMVIIFAWRMVW